MDVRKSWLPLAALAAALVVWAALFAAGAYLEIGADRPRHDIRKPLIIMAAMGFFLAFWAAPEMTVGHLILAAGMSVYILMAIRYEEHDLISLFGKDYELYREKVGMLTPKFRRKSAG